jgi:hypothetical protein
MPSAAFYRKEAERCRAAAAETHDGAAAARWLRIAKDYDALADALAVDEQRLSPTMRLPKQQHEHPAQQHEQPVQQQQTKLEE